MTDYISREAIIAYIREQAEESQKAFEELGGESGIYADAYNDLAEEFYRIPAADVEPVRHGKWDHFEENDAEFGYVRWSKCSLCHASIGRSGWLRYCPWCGAKMDLEVDHDD